MMRHFFNIQAIALICFVFSTSAQEPQPSEPEPIVPAPDRLAADWWSYFSPEESLAAGTLEQRINKSRELLNRVIENHEGEGRESMASASSRFIGSLNRFAELRRTPSPPSVANSPSPLEKYSVVLALERYRAWRRLEIDFRANSAEVDWQLSLLDAAQRQQTQLRSAYLETKSDDSNRFATGLNLMAERAGLELRAANQDRQRLHLQALQSQLKALTDELTLIPDRLQSLPSSMTHWTVEFEKAESALLEKRNSISSIESRELSSLSDASLMPIMARQAVLGETIKEIYLKVAEVEVRRATLGRFLVEILNGVPESGSLEKRESELGDYKTFSIGIDQMRAQSKVTIDHARKVAGEQNAATGTNVKLKALLQSTLTLTESADQSLHQLENSQGETGFIAGLLEERLNEEKGWLGQASNQAKHFVEQIGDRGFGALRYTLFETNDTPVNLLGILRVLLIFTVAWWASRFLQRGLQRVGGKKLVSETSLYNFGRLIHYVILTVGVMVGLSSIGLDLTKFALFASALGVGLGFGLQAIVGNFVAGLIILFEKSLNVGNFVELESGVTGEVKEINMRSTLIRTNDAVDILVPNSEFVNGRVTNWTLREAVKRIHISFGVAYGSDKELVKKAVLEAATRVPAAYLASKQREPQVWLVGFGDSSLDFELVVWLTPEGVKRPGAVHADFLWEIETSLGEYGIEIPFPQRDIHLRTSHIDFLKGTQESKE